MSKIIIVHYTFTRIVHGGSKLPTE